jgi:hypothetical protein
LSTLVTMRAEYSAIVPQRVAQILCFFSGP